MNETTMFQVRIYDLQKVLGDDVTVDGIDDMSHAFAMQMSNEEESIVMFLTDDEGIEAMAETLEKVASEIRTLKKETQQSIH